MKGLNGRYPVPREREHFEMGKPDVENFPDDSGGAVVSCVQLELPSQSSFAFHSLMKGQMLLI